MKKLLNIILVVVFSTSILLLSSCEDMLSVDSNRYITVDQNTLSTSGDSVNSVLGILRCTQKIGERYILFGEMRADLLDVTPYTPASIRQINNFTVDSTNLYANPRDYYSIINNCNYFISRTSGANNPLTKENTLVHAIRAWTYMQIAINWGKVHYCTKPLLTVDDTQQNFPVLDIAALADSLIDDLQPLKGLSYPDYGDIYEKTGSTLKSTSLFIPIKLVLGDLYLWRGKTKADFENAATCYAEYIDASVSRFGVNPIYLHWTYDNYLQKNYETASPVDSWSMFMGASKYPETFTFIQMATTPSEGIVCPIPQNLSYFTASNVINDLWDDQTYTLHVDATSSAPAANYPISGDLRKLGNRRSLLSINGSDSPVSTLYKLGISNHILLYRLGLVMLRYAEAVNRAGYPATAFAVLKYGLKSTVLTDATKIPTSEQNANTSLVKIFTNAKFDTNIGVHARGCGNCEYSTNYKIAGTDSIAWVEEAICDELALETSFEGNRFGDLMRIASRRNDLDFLAKRVAAKHGGDSQLRGLLRNNKKNWYLPEFSNNK
ncbi:MAG TPA: RagB/SusD family nutrient uptake outer membrane protein [Paludibacter sp.]